MSNKQAQPEPTLSPALAAFLEDCQRLAALGLERRRVNEQVSNNEPKEEAKVMTLTIEVAPEKEAILRAKAARRGLPLNDYVREVVEHDADQEAPDEAEVARLATIDSLKGKYAHLGITSADIRAERQRDLEREARREAA